MNRKLIIFLVLVTAIVVLYYYSISNSIKENDFIIARINNNKFYLQILDTSDKRKVGLSGRRKLESNTGMLFIFDENDRHEIWMKDMLLPIDIIWLDEEKKVVDYVTDAKPDSYPEVFRPQYDSKYVVEVNAGAIDNADIKIGDFLLWN